MKYRKFLLSAAVGTLSVLTLASASFACTVFKGKLSIVPNSGTGTGYSDGNNTNHGSCSKSSNVQLTNGSTLKVTEGKTTTCATQNFLPNATYKMSWLAGADYPTTDCMYSTTNSVGSISVTGGAGVGGPTNTTAITVATTPKHIQFCAWNSSNFYGNQIPLDVV